LILFFEAVCQQPTEEV